MSVAEIEDFLTERDQVLAWREHVLTEAGYPSTFVGRIAASDADLHLAVDLVHNGCAHETAADILL